MDRKLVCPCGLTCCDCLLYKSEIYEAAHKLKELITEHELDKFLIGNSSEKAWERLREHMDLNENQTWERIGRQFNIFKEMPVFMSVLDGLIKLQCKNTCQEAGGCSIGGNTHKCKALKCIESKKYDGCWQCDEFETCDNLLFLKNGYGYVIDENLRIVKEEGIEAVRARGNKYYAWQRR